MRSEIAGRADALTASRTPFAVATVVRRQRPSSVRPGDSAVVLADGTIEGFVGGACAEDSVRLHALRPYHVRHADMPLTPAAVWRAMRGNQFRTDLAIT